ncbi:MAG: magnesium transporter [Candidatus Kariarchaeaceae archaeon]|jgi:magnesium transporter
MDFSDLENVLSKLRLSLEENDLKAAISIIEDLQPVDQAGLVAELEVSDQVTLITQLDPSDSADVLEKMDDDIAVTVAEFLTPVQLAEILAEMEIDEAVDVLGDLTPELATKTLKRMDEPDDVISLLRYPSETAGGLMTVAVITLQPHLTVEETLAELRRVGQRSDSTYYLYVTDDSSLLLGVIGLRDLVAAPIEIPIEQIMETNFISILVTEHQDECVRIFSRYRYLALPVVDEIGRFVGVITADDLFEIAEETATKDMYRMVGITGEEKVFGSAWVAVQKRLPWLAVNMLTLFIAITVIGIFENVIAGLVAIAIFLPLVAGEGGNAGSQTTTIIIRGMALGEISSRDGRRALISEILITVANGIVIGLGTAIIAYAWKGDWRISVALCLAMIFNFLIAALTGVLVPFGLKKINVDPALASAAFVTAFTDTFGFLFFLGIVALLI